jgi:protein SCO1/2
MDVRRRALFAMLSAPVIAAPAAAAEQGQGRTARPRSRNSREPGYFPNVELRTHEGKRVRFYDDLIKGKVVTINFMFTSCSTFCPRATANLLKVQAHLGPHLGRDVSMLSITVDPEKDTPGILQKYAAEHRAKPGWQFLTGAAGDIDRIRQALGVFEENPDKTQHTGILTYGNEATGTWAAMPVIAEAAVIARAVTRLVAAGSGQ